MIRILFPLLAALAIAPGAFGQIVIRSRPGVPRPAGVIAPPALPIPGSLTPPGYTPARPRLRPYLAPNPYFNSWGFAPYWPTWYDSDPGVVTNVISIPVAAAPESTPSAPPPAPLPTLPIELHARLTMNVPSGAHVWLNGTEMDANVRPLILESPVLERDQSYTFQIKVTWPENQRTEERARVVTVRAGESKSLAYYR